MEVWDQKLAKLDQMESLAAGAETSEADLEVATMIEDAQMDVKRVIKYDIDSYIADDQMIMDDEEDEEEEGDEDKKQFLSLFSKGSSSE